MSRHWLSEWSRSLLVAAAFLALVAGACEPSVTPIVDDERTFSMVGLLDATADTQFVRVERLRDSSAIGAPPQIDASVTLVNLDSGTSVAMRDSFATLPGGFETHLFWAPVSVELDTQYEVRVSGSDGASATARFHTPANAPSVTVLRSVVLPCGRPGFGTVEVSISGVDHLAGVRTGYPIGLPPTWFTHSQDTESSETGYLATIDYYEDLQRLGGRMEERLPDGTIVPCNGCPCESRFSRDSIYVVAASTGPDGLPYKGLSAARFLRPGSTSNVDGGVGYVGAIASDTVSVHVRWNY